MLLGSISRLFVPADEPGERSKTMRWSPALLSLVIPLACVAAAGGTPPAPVTLTLAVDFTEPAPHGTFTASAPLCSSGTFVTEVVGGGPPRPTPAPAFAFTGRQHFTCADSSGAFVIQFHPQSNPKQPLPSGPWAALGGTGAYVGLDGSGEFSIVAFTSPTTAIASFTGDVHFD
jgi:hypothetical protein